jgi:RND family efflux transporter MFP subunit
MRRTLASGGGRFMVKAPEMRLAAVQPLSLNRSITLTVIAGALIVAASACGRDEATSSETPPEVTVSAISPVLRELPRITQVTGTLFGDEETTIAAKVEGRVVEVLKDLGDTVGPGDPLVRVDPTDYELERAEREGAFREALARLGLSELPGEGFDVETLPSVERARLQAENASARYERAKVLAERKPPLISEQDFADIETAREVAQSNLKVERLTAEATLAEVRRLRSQVDIAEQRVRDTLHRAPAATSVMREDDSGVDDERVYEVAARIVTAGDFVKVGSPLLKLVDADPLKLRVPVTERRLGTIKKGQPVAVKVEAFPDAFAGEVSRVSPAVDTATRTFGVEILVRNPARRLKPGSFATARVETGREPVLMVPESAVRSFAGLNKLVLVREGKAAEQQVELGERHDGMVEVQSGLSAADVVVVSATTTLTTGMPVKVTTNSVP